MKTYQEIFDQILSLRKEQLPFVIFKTPGTQNIKLLWQSDIKLHLFDSERSSGFVMAPFSHSQAAYYIPDSQSMESVCDGLALKMTPEISSKASKKNTTFTNNTQSEAAINHQKLVSKAVAKIKSAEFEKVVLAREEFVYTDLDPMDLFNKLLTRYEEAFCYWFYHPSIGNWQGATPELLMELNSESIKTIALAGTTQFDPLKDPDWTEKERHEQQLVTKDVFERLGVLNLSPFKGDAYSVKAGNLCHLRTDIKASMTSDIQLKDLIESLHPSPAISGLPRNKASLFIQENEGLDRQFYAGYLGMVTQEASAKGKTDTKAALYVNLRCMSLEGPQAKIYVGSGITIGSDPHKEWEETVHKTQTMKQVLVG